ncbi:MAG: hypothetical protein JW894_11795 [Bacteroidales bacterium]|nr:hypothetical protein [Bacteroidales bacterium]
MKGQKYLFLILILILGNKFSILGQSLIWQAGNYTFFDNREYFNEFVAPQTMFGVRTFGTIGFAINKHNDILAGADLLYEFGGTIQAKNLKPVLYYHHNKNTTNLYFGTFPRKDIINLPNVLQTDTFQYYRPQVEGIYLEFTKPWGSQNIWLDWTSRQTDVNRESFLVGGTGRLKAGSFFYRHDFIISHFAGPAIDIPGDHIHDNIGLCAAVGLNLSTLLPLDSVIISAGYTMSYDHLRTVYDFHFKHGSISEIYARYKMIGVRSVFYLGQGQEQFVGDHFYRAHYYNRTDLVWYIFNNKNIRGKVQFTIHFLEDKLDVSQLFTIYSTLNGSKKIKSDN